MTEGIGMTSTISTTDDSVSFPNPNTAGIPGEWRCKETLYVSPAALPALESQPHIAVGMGYLADNNLAYGAPYYLHVLHEENTPVLRILTCREEYTAHLRSYMRNWFAPEFYDDAQAYHKADILRDGIMHKDLLLFGNIGMLEHYFLMFSFLYYRENESVVPDEFFDAMCKALLRRRQEARRLNLAVYSAESLVDDAMLTQGSGHDIGKYPERVKQAAHMLMDKRIKVA